jgi:hypothetical protein
MDHFGAGTSLNDPDAEGIDATSSAIDEEKEEDLPSRL